MSSASETPSPKEVVETYCRYLNALDFPSIFKSLLSPTATWWIVGRPDLGTPWGGLRTFAERREEVEGLTGQFVNYSYDIHNITADGDTVVVDGRVEAQHANGARYSNDMLLMFTVKDGKVETMREYIDNRELEAYMLATVKAT